MVSSLKKKELTKKNDSFTNYRDTRISAEKIFALTVQVAVGTIVACFLVWRRILLDCKSNKPTAFSRWLSDAVCETGEN